MKVNYKDLVPPKAEDLSTNDWNKFNTSIYDDFMEFGKMKAETIYNLMISFEESLKNRENPYSNMSPEIHGFSVFSGFFINEVWNRLKEVIQNTSEQEELTYKDFHFLWEIEDMRSDISRSFDEEEEGYKLSEGELKEILQIGTSAKKHPETCFKYYESIGTKVLDDGKSYKYIQINVRDNVSAIVYGESYSSVAKAWETVFITQPNDMPFYRAGWILENFLYPDSGEEVFCIIGDNFEADTFWATYTDKY